MRADPRTGPDIAYRGFRTAAQFGTGSTRGGAPTAAGLAMSAPTAERMYTDPHTGRAGRYESASWTSPEVRPGFAATEVIPSWTADTPGGSWVEIELRGRTGAGALTGWYTLARWAGDDAVIRRTTVPAQADADGSVDADTLTARPDRPWSGWWLRCTLHRPVGSADVPVLRSIGAVASRDAAAPGAAPAGPARTRPDGGTGGPRPGRG
ncbi:hypothetical protein [Micromonospora zhanjiangensis]